MVKKIRRVRTFARTASKSMEKNLINNAKKLRDNPFLVLPEYNDKYSQKTFKKLRKGLEKIDSFKNNIDKLEKLSNKRTLDGAVAGTILLAHTEKAPYLAVARLPSGDISYAQRGKSDKFKLIASQYFDNPIYKLFGIRDIAINKNNYVYSWDNGFIATGKFPKPPSDFILFISKQLDLKYNNQLIKCSHLTDNIIKNDEIFEEPFIRINWKSANVKIGICEKCLKKSQNTVFTITKYMIGPKLNEDFDINIIAKLIENNNIIDSHQIEFLDEYYLGKITDLDLILKNISKREEIIKESGEKLFVLNNKSYGSDIKSFIRALNPNKFEKIGLEHIFKNTLKPVILKNVSSSKVLDIYWEEFGFEIINSILKNEKLTNNFLNLDENPSEILELVFSYVNRKNILSDLPKYNSLPPLAEYADKIAKVYKTHGINKTIVELKEHPDSTKMRSLKYAFLIILNKAKDNKWRFSNIEIESGEFLKPFAEKFLKSKPEEYHDNLKQLLNASGISVDIDKFKN